MNRTPILRKLRDNGATLYVFPSASEDIGLNLNSRATGVAMSHYALLNIPNLYGKGDESTKLATGLQNYVMNMETVLLNNDNYNYQEYHTVSERVFWHWLYKNRKKLVLDQTKKDGSKSDIYYSEKFKGNKNRIVQCFGSIDAGNSLSTEFGMFNETYVNVPSSYGNGPVFFKHVQDSSESNYIWGREYKVETDADALQGRKGKMSVLKILEDEIPQYDNNNSYSITDALEIVKDPSEIQEALKEYTGKDDIIINSYDDVNIDNKEQFKDTDFDITSNAVEFEFNTILLYYSVYDSEDTTKSAYAINLFGVVFLDSAQSVDANGSKKIEVLKKKKSFSSFNGGNFFGNSYSFRVNIKTMSVYDNTDSIIQDNTTMSSITSVDFSDVVSNLNRAIDVMNTNVQSTMAIQDNYMKILQYHDDQKSNIEDLSTKLNAYINGTKSSTVEANLLKVNDIRSLDSSNNMIKVTLNRRMTDYIDTSYYQGDTYIAPLIITNDYDNFNVPTVYTPIMDLADTAMGEWQTDEDGVYQDVKSIIENTSINFYTYMGKSYPNIVLPEATLSGLGLDSLYKSGKNIDENDEVIKDTKYVNFNGMIPLLISYIQQLNFRLNQIEQVIN